MTVQNRRFSNKQVAAIVAALCLGLGLAPAGAVAASQSSSTASTASTASSVNPSQQAGVARDSVADVSPADTWSFVTVQAATYYDLTPPKDVPINLSTLFLGGDRSATYAYLAIYAKTVPATATHGCRNAGTATPQIIWQGEMIYPDTVTVTFGVPLTRVPVAGKKICLYAYLNHDGGALFDVNGYYG